KNFDTGNAIGPWIVIDEPHDPMKVRVQTRVNGVTRQDWSTTEMMYSFAETAVFISKYLRLGAGDIIWSGTGHGTAAEYGKDGDRWVKPGDKLEVEVEGVGVLRNNVVAW
ncbi:MAG: fumarylacetoacetate hydrolase family protein, partial [Burkholderiales bacterium]